MEKSIEELEKSIEELMEQFVTNNQEIIKKEMIDHIISTATPLDDPHDDYTAFDNFLNEVNQIKLPSNLYHVTYAKILRTFDPAQYEAAFSDWADDFAEHTDNIKIKEEYYDSDEIEECINEYIEELSNDFKDMLEITGGHT